MADTDRKNRRYIGSKLSEHRLKKLVECFARDMTVRDTAATTRISERTIADIFMRIRERLFQYGFMPVQRDPSEPVVSPARFVFERKHRGIPDKYHLLYEAEFLHRVMLAQNLDGFRKLSASDPADMKKARSMERYNESHEKRYNLIEMRPAPGAPDGSETLPFEPGDTDPRSTILVNEVKVDPHGAFFAFVWQLLLKHPLRAGETITSVIPPERLPPPTPPGAKETSEKQDGKAGDNPVGWTLRITQRLTR